MKGLKLESSFHCHSLALGHALDTIDLTLLRAVSRLDAKGERLDEPIAEKLLRIALRHFDWIVY